MSEEEIIKITQTFIDRVKNTTLLNGSIYTPRDVKEIEIHAIQGLLDLYNKEKMNSSNLSEQLNKEKELSLKRFKNLVKIQKEKDESYNNGYFQGVRDERDNTEEHIKEVIEGLNRNIVAVNDNLSGNYKYAKKILQELLEED